MFTFEQLTKNLERSLLDLEIRQAPLNFCSLSFELKRNCLVKNDSTPKIFLSSKESSLEVFTEPTYVPTTDVYREGKNSFHMDQGH